MIKYLCRAITTASFRTTIARFRYFLNSDVKIYTNTTFADDGLISEHISDFMNDKKFLHAYQQGTAQGGLENHSGGIQFRVYICCWAAAYASKLDGDFVECGVGKGVISKAICVYLNFNEYNKNFYLFDTFSGIPIEDASSDLERENISKLNHLHFDSDYSELVMESFRDFPNVKVVKGKIPNSLSSIKLERVSYISIDMNNATAEIAAIEYLWDKIVSGGVIVLDDYAYGEEFRDQKNAWDRFAKDIGIEILSLPTGQGLIIKH